MISGEQLAALDNKVAQLKADAADAAAKLELSKAAAAAAETARDQANAAAADRDAANAKALATLIDLTSFVDGITKA